MRSFSRVPFSSRWARNEFQEERQRICNDGEVKRNAWKNIKERKRELSPTKANLTSHFHCEIAGAEVTCRDKRKRADTYTSSFSLSRGERPRKRKSDGHYTRTEDREARLPPGYLRTRNRKDSEIV